MLKNSDEEIKVVMKMNIEFYEVNDENKSSVVVIYATYNEKIVMCKHKERTTWEIPGGHIEKNETPESAAKRELYEETGATSFTLIPVCKYSFDVNGKKVFSLMFKAVIDKLEKLPESEIKEISLFDKLPENVTYPEIYAKILKK